MPEFYIYPLFHFPDNSSGKFRIMKCNFYINAEWYFSYRIVEITEDLSEAWLERNNSH